jgi:hypothetical protein
MRVTINIHFDVYKEHQQQYNRSYYQKNKKRILARAKERRSTEEAKAKRKIYRKEYWLKKGK